jgi:uncharacterized surface protein with fasciclin (FAS1) repeats
MKKFLLVICALLLLPLGWAQETQPVDPATEMAMVRVAHFSPNAPEVSIELRSDDAETIVTADELAALSYLDTTEFLSVTPGSYTVTVVADGQIVLEENVSFAGNNHYTVAAIGLVLPDNVMEEDENEGGFFEWLGSLFTGDDPADRDELGLRLEVYNDDLFVALEPGETRIRAVHAAPGTAPIDIAVQGERGSIIGNLGFGAASNYHNIDEAVGALEVRIAGSRALVLDLADVELIDGQVNTMFIVGTTLEDTPIEVVVFSDAPMMADPMVGDPAAPVDPVAPPADPAAPVDPATEPVEPVDPDVETEPVEPEPTDEEVDDEAEVEQTELDTDASVAVIIATEDDLGILTTALIEAGLVDALSENGPYTVFAPTNAAFEALPEGALEELLADTDRLREVLLYHVIEGAVSSDEVADGEVASLQGSSLLISTEDGVRVSGAEVIEADLRGTNGIVHKIDTVLLPEGLQNAND